MHEDAPEGYFTIIQNPLRQEQITHNPDTHLEYICMQLKLWLFKSQHEILFGTKKMSKHTNIQLIELFTEQIAKGSCYFSHETRVLLRRHFLFCDMLPGRNRTRSEGLWISQHRGLYTHILRMSNSCRTPCHISHHNCNKNEIKRYKGN